jgi:hypothetical protein
MSECHQRLLNEFTKRRILEPEEKACKPSILESREPNLSESSNEKLAEQQQSIKRFYNKK